MQIDPMSADRKHPRSWEPLPGTSTCPIVFARPILLPISGPRPRRIRSKGPYARQVYLLTMPQDMTSLPPMKRQQLSGGTMQSTSSLTSSFRQTGMPMAVPDQHRVDQGVSFMSNPQQAGHMGNM